QTNLGTINRYGLTNDPNTNSTETASGVATVFDDRAVRSIVDTTASAPYVGHFRPEVSTLRTMFGGLTRAQLVGTWTLTVIDEANDGATPVPLMRLQGWGVNFTGRTVGYGNFQVGSTLRFGTDVVVTG